VDDAPHAVLDTLRADGADWGRVRPSRRARVVRQPPWDPTEEGLYVDYPLAQIEGRVRDVGSEFVLACDMRFAARESALFGQPEPGLGVIPGGGGVQHLARLMGRARRWRSC